MEKDIGLWFMIFAAAGATYLIIKGGHIIISLVKTYPKPTRVVCEITGGDHQEGESGNCYLCGTPMRTNAVPHD